MYRPLEPAIELLPAVAEIAACGVKYTDVAVPPEMQPLADPSARRQQVTRMTKQLSNQIAQYDKNA